MKKLLALFLTLCLTFSLGTAVLASGEASGSAEAAADSLSLTDPAWELSADGSYCQLKNVVYCLNDVNPTYQYMNIYVPAAYMNGGTVNGYTASSAPIVLENNCMGWNSSAPGNANTGYLAEGFVFVSCGARSRNAENGTGKMPAPVVDQKAAVRCLRLNDAVIPGDKDRIVSVGSSGGGQMSSILGATGNMEEYYPWLYEIGAAGIDLVNGEYISTIDDDIFASMCYCPIADLNNADLAYAWFRYDAGEVSAMTMFSGEIEFNTFQMELQNDLALAFCEYINSLGIVNEDGVVLSFDLKADGTPDPRSGSYYDQVLENISNALNAYVAEGGELGGASGELADTDAWLAENADGSYAVTDLAGFLNGTGLARNKNIPGFDTFFATEEGNGFGTEDEGGVHFSASVAAVLEANYDKYAALPGFGDEDVDEYIAQANRADIEEQAYLMNATQIMLDVAAGSQQADISRHWRTRNGTADEHTSFSIAYNLAMSAMMAGAEDVDYSLVWNMPHGANEGTSTGTFEEWVHDICGRSASGEPASAEASSAEPAGNEASGEASGSISGTYTYNETNVFGLEIAWTLVLNENGTYALSEENAVAGFATYTGTYSASGNIVTCGPMAEDGPGYYDWADPAGFTVTVSGNTFVPGGDASGGASAELSKGGWPLSGSGDTSLAAFKAYLKAYMDCVPEMDGHEEELYGLIDAESWAAPVAMAWENWFEENAMTYDEFVAVNGTYSLHRFVITSPAG